MLAWFESVLLFDSFISMSWNPGAASVISVFHFKKKKLRKGNSVMHINFSNRYSAVFGQIDLQNTLFKKHKKNCFQFS